ncbi:MAG TPA: hypothetical protein VM912_13225 [Terriglobales bacterium]|nr:hypothetical protein [Terriglobales bacterium]
MPIPEPSLYRPSNLTRQQRQEQLASIYGVPMNLTPEEIERMRQIVQQHDSDRKPIQTVDLNNPPKQPYRFQKFPMMVYDLVNSHPAHDEERPSRNGFGMDVFHVPAKVISLMVQSEEQLQEALAAGWSEQAPDFSEERVEALSAAYQAEVEQVEERRRRGRPRKAE